MNAEPATSARPELAYIIGPAIDAVWTQVFEHVARACDRTLTPDNVRQAIREGQACMWVIRDEDMHIQAAAVTQVKRNGANQWLEVLTLGGEAFADWSAELQRAFEGYAAQYGCDAIRACARPGMAKWLERLGWRRRQVIMEWTDG